MRRTAIGLVAVVALSACDGTPLPEFEGRLAALEANIESAQEKAAKAPAPGAANEERARMSKAFSAFRQAHQAGDKDLALKLGEAFVKEFKNQRAADVVVRALMELTLEGSDARPLDVEKWYQGQATLADSEVTLLVFWETWCPHCKREVPKLEATHQKYKGKGLTMVGLTKVTKSSTDDSVEAFIRDHKLTYAVGKVTEKTNNDYAVNGVPAAAAVKDGKVIWRGHPGRLDDATIEGWLGS